MKVSRPSRKRAQELLGIRVARGLPQLRRRSRPSCRSADCRAREAAKITVSCGTIAMRCADVGGIGVAQVDAVEQDAARLRIVEALGELEDGRLARARRTDDREPLARLERRG